MLVGCSLSEPPSMRLLPLIFCLPWRFRERGENNECRDGARKWIRLRGWGINLSGDKSWHPGRLPAHNRMVHNRSNHAPAMATPPNHPNSSQVKEDLQSKSLYNTKLHTKKRQHETKN
jgi:hypothetical protein